MPTNYRFRSSTPFYRRSQSIFYQPGKIYSSGITGIAQILTTVSTDWLGFYIPVSVALLLLNIPLFFLGWFKIGHKFTIFTGITVVLTSLFVQILPEETLTTDPMICGIFGSHQRSRYWLCAKSGLSSGGLDFVSIAIRKRTGKTIGSISIFSILPSCLLRASCSAGSMRYIVPLRFLSVVKSPMLFYQAKENAGNDYYENS